MVLSGFSGKKKTRLFQKAGESEFLWAMTGSNCRHPACKAGALPAELIARINTLMRLLFLLCLKREQAGFFCDQLFCDG